MTEDDYAAHPEASLRFGFDSGPMYVLSMNRRGNATFEVWRDQDYEVEAKPPRGLANLGHAKAVELWGLLASGNVLQLEAIFDADA